MTEQKNDVPLGYGIIVLPQLIEDGKVKTVFVGFVANANSLPSMLTTEQAKEVIKLFESEASHVRGAIIYEGLHSGPTANPTTHRGPTDFLKQLESQLRGVGLHHLVIHPLSTDDVKRLLAETPSS
jgi:hypothetical protein